MLPNQVMCSVNPSASALLRSTSSSWPATGERQVHTDPTIAHEPHGLEQEIEPLVKANPPGEEQDRIASRYERAGPSGRKRSTSVPQQPYSM